MAAPQQADLMDMADWQTPPPPPGGSVPPPGGPPPQQPPAPTVGPGAPGWDAAVEPMRTPPRRSLPVVPIVIAAVVLVGTILVLGSGSFSGTSTISGAGRPYSFDYPSDLEVAEQTDIPQSFQRNGIQNLTAVGNDDTIIVVGGFPGMPAGTSVKDPGIRNAMTQKAQQLSSLTGQQIGAPVDATVAGQPALRFESPGADGNAASETVYAFVANGAAYTIDCNGKPGTDNYKNACDTVVKSFKIN